MEYIRPFYYFLIVTSLLVEKVPMEKESSIYCKKIVRFLNGDQKRITLFANACVRDKGCLSKRLYNGGWVGRR